MTTQDIRNRLKEAKDFKEAEKIAEKLTYEVSYRHREDSWRARYDWIKADDFEFLGWTVYCLGVKDNKFQKSLMGKGYVPLAHTSSWSKPDEKFLYDKDKKIIFQFDDYGRGKDVSIEFYRVGDLITLNEYKSLLAHKLGLLVEKRDGLTAYIEGLIEKEKQWYEHVAEEETKEKIVAEALDEARREGLIKS